jgi:hypothetical protein
MAPPFRDNSRGKGTVMDWTRILAYVTGTVDQELLARNEYLAAENRILKSQLNGRLKLSDAERAMLGKIGHRLGRQANWHQLGSPIAPVMTKEHARANRSDDFANGQMIQSPSGSFSQNQM